MVDGEQNVRRVETAIKIEDMITREETGVDIPIFGTQVSMDKIREMIDKVLAERRLLPAPIATDKFPMPKLGCCSLCRRCWQTTPNPLKGRQSPFLEASRAGSNTCISCRNTLNWAYKGRGV